jgi:hypothetical protein
MRPLALPTHLGYELRVGVVLVVDHGVRHTRAQQGLNSRLLAHECRTMGKGDGGGGSVEQTILALRAHVAFHS